MAVTREARLTAGDVARQLGVTIEGVLDLVDRGKLEGAPDPRTDRLLFSAAAVRRYQEEHSAAVE